jgi:modification methylase
MDNWAKIFIADSRSMKEVANSSVDLVVTSPPYWHIKDYGISGQIGYGQTLHQYLIDLYYTWTECFRILREGSRLCINIGDQFARSVIYGRYKVIPLHAEFIAQCEKIGFDFMGSIIWQKKTTMNPTGGAVVMGSYPFPPNGIVEIDYEFILIFKKPGKSKKVSTEIKEASKLSKDEWKQYFAGHWYFGGARQLGHEAMFPEELPRRLIKMFTFQGETVIDPFLGSGTTMKVGLELKRNVIGYEINEAFYDIITAKIGLKDTLPTFFDEIKTIKRVNKLISFPVIEYIPIIKDANPQEEIDDHTFKRNKLNKVVKIIDENTVKLDDGQQIGFLGVIIQHKDKALKYLNENLLGKKVTIEYDYESRINNDVNMAYIYLKNRIFINGYLIKSGLGFADEFTNHRLVNKFFQYMKKRDELNA